MTKKEATKLALLEKEGRAKIYHLKATFPEQFITTWKKNSQKMSEKGVFADIKNNPDGKGSSIMIISELSADDALLMIGFAVGISGYTFQ